MSYFYDGKNDSFSPLRYTIRKINHGITVSLFFGFLYTAAITGNSDDIGLKILPYILLLTGIIYMFLSTYLTKKIENIIKKFIR